MIRNVFRAAGYTLEDLLWCARASRVVIVVLMVLVAGLHATPQATDLLITLGQSTSPRAWLAFVGSVAWLGLNAWFWSRFILGRRLPRGGSSGPSTPARRRQRARVRTWLPRILGAVPFLDVAFALSGAAGRIPPQMRAQMSGMESGSERLELAAVLMALLGAAFFYVLAKRRTWMGRLRAGLTARGVSDTAFAARALQVPRAPREVSATLDSISPSAWLMLVASGAVALAGMVLYGVAPVRTARHLQSGPTIFFAAAGLICGGTILARLGARWHVPLLSLLLLAALVLAALRDSGLIPDNHDLRIFAAPLPRRPDLDEAFRTFLAASAPRYPAPQPIPVVLVATSGGGLAAAFWTATVLGDLADGSPQFAEQLFAISGVSGGSLGELEFVAALGVRTTGVTCASGKAHRSPSPETPSLRGCTQLALSEDFLGPTLGTLLYPDLMQRFLPFPAFADRAAALERAWEEQWQAVFHDDRLTRPFFGLWRPQHPWPALLLNGTSFFTGGRLVTSNLALRLESGAREGAPLLSADAADLLQLANADIPASTAANNGARFPYVGPLGTIRRQGPAGSPPGSTADVVVDGGYFENFGATTLLDVLDFLDQFAQQDRRAVRFIVIQIISAPDSAIEGDAGQLRWRAGTGSILSRGLIGPVATLLRSRGARGVNATESLARRTLALGGTYVPIRLGLSPTGATAPLGWSLSAVARHVIDEQWTVPCRDRLLAEMGLSPGSLDLRNGEHANPQGEAAEARRGMTRERLTREFTSMLKAPACQVAELPHPNGGAR